MFVEQGNQKQQDYNCELRFLRSLDQQQQWLLWTHELKGGVC